jgi:hypothetical protein
MHRSRLLLPAVALLSGLMACTNANATNANATQAAHGGTKYTGTWNYDQPDSTSLRNIAVLSCPASNPECPTEPGGARPSLEFPQIGNITFSKNNDGGITGHTDQGCTWYFKVEAHSLELTSAQTCFNKVVDSSYTITTWSVSVAGRHEKETLIATSHQPTGDWDFVLRTGVRTKVDPAGRLDATRRFTGRWTYAPAVPPLVNIVTNVGQDGQVTQVPRTGAVVFTKRNNHTVTARTADGCRWHLRTRGNTAELQPAGQTCRLSASTEQLNFWSIASDGKRQASIMNGVIEKDGEQSTFVLSVGSLTKQ